MKKFTLLLFTIFISTYVIGQTGDEITDPIICIDNTPVLASDVANSTASTIMAPNCGTDTDDTFYSNEITVGDNKITISMVTTVAVLTTINYQILRAPGGDINNLEEVLCSSYEVVAGAPPVTTDGGSFEYVITSNVDSGDRFYLRVYKPSGLASNVLQTLFNNTTVEMTSENDFTLSNSELSFNKHKIINNKNELRILNNLEFNTFKIYSLVGKMILNKSNAQPISTIDTSFLGTGLYVLSLENKNSSKRYKFIKP